MDTFPLWFGRLAVMAFFAIAFLQSAADKWLDSRGNLEYLTGHFANSPLRATVSPMFWAITVLESLAGVLCGLGALQILFGLGTVVALIGLVLVIISLLCLFFGQRLAKDYGGAVVLASYFAVALLGLILVGIKAG
jgi:putative oxidoreductase